MSERLTMQEVLKEYGVPLIKLDVHATRSECLALREKLIAPVERLDDFFLDRADILVFVNKQRVERGGKLFLYPADYRADRVPLYSHIFGYSFL